MAGISSFGLRKYMNITLGGETRMRAIPTGPKGQGLIQYPEIGFMMHSMCKPMGNQQA